jgi:hypothetical protein
MWRQALATFTAAEGRAAKQLAQTEAQRPQGLPEQREWEELATAAAAEAQAQAEAEAEADAKAQAEAEADQTALGARLAEPRSVAQRQGGVAVGQLPPWAAFTAHVVQFRDDDDPDERELDQARWCGQAQNRIDCVERQIS